MSSVPTWWLGIFAGFYDLFCLGASHVQPGQPPGDRLGNNLDRMFGLPATNTFMLKMNYWFNL